MRAIARSALRELDLDYVITLVSSGASRNYEVVMWDQPRNSYFSIRVHWEPGLSREQMTGRVVQQLTERLATWRSRGVSRFGERRPRRYGTSQRVSGAASHGSTATAPPASSQWG